MKQKISAEYSNDSKDNNKKVSQEETAIVPVTSSGDSNTAIVPATLSTSKPTYSDKKAPTHHFGEKTAIALRSASNSLTTSSTEPPVFHPHWILKRVISGDKGWLRTVDVDPDNKFIATGSNEGAIRIIDRVSGKRLITLFKHTSSCTSLKFSPRHNYLFSCGEDKQVYCWDLEQNKPIRHYHGHQSGVYCLSIHPSLDIIATGGRDSSCRIWDIRSQVEVMRLVGHTDTVMSVVAQAPFV